MRKVLSIMVAAIMLAACLTGCSESSATEDSKTNSRPESSSVTETTTTTVATTTAPTTTTQVTTTAPAKPAETDSIAKAYRTAKKAQNCELNTNYTADSFASQDAVLSNDGKRIYFLKGKNVNGKYDGSKCIIYCYDIETKKVKPLIERDKSISQFAYYEDKIYAIYLNNNYSVNFYVAMYDKNGKLINEINNDNTKYNLARATINHEARVLDNGKIAILGLCEKAKDDPFEHAPELGVIFSEDLKKDTVVYYDNEAEHGLSSKKIPSGITNRGFYNAKVLSRDTGEAVLEIYDSDKANWSKTKYNIDTSKLPVNVAMSPSLKTVNIYGDYLFAYSKIYGRPDDGSIYDMTFDLNSGNVLNISTSYNYRGGEKTYYLKEKGINDDDDSKEGWYVCDAITKSKEDREYTMVSKQPAKGGNICMLNDTYYWFVDSYGCFLRTYENGEDQEQKVFIIEGKD